MFKFSILFLVLAFSLSSFAQVTLNVRINSGSSGTSCTDGAFGGGPEPHWRVEVVGQGYTTYPSAGICFTNPPNTQYSEVFNCSSSYPNNLQVCLRAFEDDGNNCVVSQSCLVQICQNFATPAVGASVTYNLTIPNDGSNASWGTVNFTISASGSWPGQGNDLICNAIDLGTLNSGSSIGNSGLSNYENYCASSAGDPSPWGGNNNQGVWFKFTTGPSPSAIISFDANNDPQSAGDQIDLQLALYSSSNGLCSGALTLVMDEYQGLGVQYDEDMDVNCLLPNTTYYLLVDGEEITIPWGGQSGYFGLQINDNGIQSAGDEICDAENLGLVTSGGTVATPLLSRTNVCATNTNDPTPSAWSSDQSVWFMFQAPPSGNVIITANSDLAFPAGTDAIDIELALYETSDGTCTGAPTHIESIYAPADLNEVLTVYCLAPFQNYWVLLDGSAVNVSGIFDISISDGGVFPATNNIVCDAIIMGQPTAGGSVSLTNQHNFCADNLLELSASSWTNEQSVWFTFIAPASGNVTIDALSDANALGNEIDLQLALWYADDNTCTGNFIEVASEYDNSTKDEAINTNCLVPGRVYYLQIDGEDGLADDQDGWFDVVVTDAGGTSSIPYNNDICDAHDFGIVGAIQTLAAESNACANIELGEVGVVGYATNTVWYQFTAPSSGKIEINVTSTDAVNGMDPEVYLHSSSNNGCNGVLTEINSAIQASPSVTENITSNCLIPGNVYFIQVDGHNAVLEGTYDISIQNPEPLYGTGAIGDNEPTNNDCSNAIDITVQAESCFTGSGTFSQFNYGEPTITYNNAFTQTCGANCGETWYQFTMPGTGSVLIEGDNDNVGGFSSTLNVIAYSGTCGSLTPLDCSQGGLGVDISFMLSEPAGSTILLQVFSEAGASDSELFALCISEGCGYDACLDAYANPIDNTPYCFNTLIATGEDIASGEPGYDECSEGDNPENSIYYSFQTDATGSDITIVIVDALINGSCVLGVSPSDGFNLSLFEDNTPCDNNPTSLIDCQSFTACDAQPINWSNIYSGLTPNSTFIIQIDGGFGNLGGNTSGSIIVTGTQPLAVNLIDFYGKQANQSNLLSWSTSSEVNNNYFTLKHSLEGEFFKTIKKIKGNGNSSMINKYSYEHANPSQGTNYYQLLQTDFDGKQTNYGIISISNNSIENRLIIIPNPVNLNPQILIESNIEEEVSLEITDIKGTSILIDKMQLIEGTNYYSFDSSTLKPGMYFFNLTSKQEKRTAKFVK